jgi:hypothetical protein
MLSKCKNDKMKGEMKTIYYKKFFKRLMFDTKVLAFSCLLLKRKERKEEKKEGELL